MMFIVRQFQRIRVWSFPSSEGVREAASDLSHGFQLCCSEDRIGHFWSLKEGFQKGRCTHYTFATQRSFRSRACPQHPRGFSLGHQIAAAQTSQQPSIRLTDVHCSRYQTQPPERRIRKSPDMHRVVLLAADDSIAEIIAPDGEHSAEALLLYKGLLDQLVRRSLLTAAIDHLT